MSLHVGQSVVYPYRGPCRIDPVIKKTIGGRPRDFYPLVLLDNSGDVIFVPVNKLGSLGIRQLVKKTDVPELLQRLRKNIRKAESPRGRTTWRDRATENLNLMASRSAFDLAVVIGSLTDLNDARKLAPRDREVLEKARKHLICEISEVTGETKNVAEERIDGALNRLNRGMPAVA